MTDGMTDNRSQLDTGPTPEWVRRMAQAEGDQEIGAGFESASLAEPPVDASGLTHLFERMVRVERDIDLLSQRLGAKHPAADPVRLEALRIARDWRPELPVIEVIELATVIARFLGSASVAVRAAEPARPNPSVSAADGTKAAVQPAGSDEDLMDRLDRHAKVIQVAFPRVSVSFSEALHIADAIRLDDARINGEHADRLKQAAATPQSSAETELPPYLAAEVGDVVEIQFTGGSPMVGYVTGVGGQDDTHRLAVRYGHHGWIPNECIKRIVRKASETGK